MKRQVESLLVVVASFGVASVLRLASNFSGCFISSSVICWQVWNMQSAPPAQHSLPGHVGQVHSLAVGNNMLFSGAQVRFGFLPVRMKSAANLVG